MNWCQLYFQWKYIFYALINIFFNLKIFYFNFYNVLYAQPVNISRSSYFDHKYFVCSTAIISRGRYPVEAGRFLSKQGFSTIIKHSQSCYNDWQNSSNTMNHYYKSMHRVLSCHYCFYIRSLYLFQLMALTPIPIHLSLFCIDNVIHLNINWSTGAKSNMLIYRNQLMLWLHNIPKSQFSQCSCPIPHSIVTEICTFCSNVVYYGSGAIWEL